jgi:hypothetical protein
MIRALYKEEWKEITIEHTLQMKYAVSNHGRIISYPEDMGEGRLLKGRLVNGYASLSYKYRLKKKIKNKTLYVHKLVAEYFIPKKSEDQTYVIHLDNDKNNNHWKNLSWATRKEMYDHQNKNPLVVAKLKRMQDLNRERDGKKLTETKVKLLKKKLADPNRKTRMKVLAQQFGISEMQLYRIKTGENWGHVTVD